MTIDRRTLAKGTLWSVPVIVAAADAPAYAASPCASYRAGQPLPVSAFTTTYVIRMNESLGGPLADKQLALDFGFRISDEARLCGVRSGSISSVNNGGTSRVRLSNGSLHNATNGGSVPANGSVGSVDTLCQSGLNGTEACGTSGQSAYDVRNSKNTGDFPVTGVSIYRSVTVSGYGTTVLYLNASFPATSENRVFGIDLSVTAQPQF